MATIDPKAMLNLIDALGKRPIEYFDENTIYNFLNAGVQMYLKQGITAKRLTEGIYEAQRKHGRPVVNKHLYTILDRLPPWEKDQFLNVLYTLQMDSEHSHEYTYLSKSSANKYDDNKYYYGTVSLDELHIEHGDIDAMATGMQYLSPSYPDRKYNHLREMLQRLWLRTDRMHESFSIDDRFKYQIPEIVAHIGSNFSDYDINAVHQELVDYYRNNPRRGKPKGSKNKNKVMAYTPNTPETPVNIPMVDELPKDENDQPEVTPNVDHIDLSKFVLKQDFQLHVRRVDNDLNNLTHDLDTLASDHRSLHARVMAIIESRPTVVTLQRQELPPMELGVQHKHFPELLMMCNSRQRNGQRLNVWLYGPAGTGKTTAAHKVADAMGLDFYSLPAMESGFQILGYNDSHGKYVTTPFRQCWEFGGVLIMDESDSYSPSAALAANGALANGVASFADKMVPRHPNCIIIAGANTTGLGGTLEYSGRMKLDAAFLDRWCFLDWPIDEALEDSLCANKDWLAVVRHVRRNVIAKQMKGVMITPRATIYGESLIAAGLSVDRVKKSVLYKGMSDAQIAMVQ